MFEHIFICLLPSLHYLWRNVSKFFAHDWIGFLWGFVIGVLEFSIVDINPSSPMWFTNILSHCGLSFYSTDSVLWCTKVLKFDQVQVVYFFFCRLCFCCHKCENHCQIQCREAFPLCFFEEFLVLTHMFRSLNHVELIFNMMF